MERDNGVQSTQTWLHALGLFSHSLVNLSKNFPPFPHRLLICRLLRIARKQTNVLGELLWVLAFGRLEDTPHLQFLFFVETFLFHTFLLFTFSPPLYTNKCSQCQHCFYAVLAHSCLLFSFFDICKARLMTCAFSLFFCFSRPPSLCLSLPPLPPSVCVCVVYVCVFVCVCLGVGWEWGRYSY